jgi:hypothetical protein
MLDEKTYEYCYLHERIQWNGSKYGEGAVAER